MAEEVQRLPTPIGSPSKGRKRAIIWWAILGTLLAGSLAGWLWQIEPQQIKFRASCEEAQLSSESPVVFSMLGLRRVDFFGATGQIDNITTSVIKDSRSKAVISSGSNSITLQDAGSTNSPAFSITITGHTGPFIAAFSKLVIVKRLANDGSNVVLEYQPKAFEISFQEDDFSVSADRMHLEGINVDEFSLSARNQSSMAQLKVQPAPGRTSVIQTTFAKLAPIKVSVPPSTNIQVLFD
jgi:hypothetical protein